MASDANSKVTRMKCIPGFCLTRRLAVLAIFDLVAVLTIEAQAVTTPAATGVASTTGSNAISLPAGVFTTVLSQSITVDAAKTGLYDIASQLSFSNTSASQNFLTRLVLDGSPVGVSTATTVPSSSFATLSLPSKQSLSAGTHTLNLQISPNSSTVSGSIFSGTLTATGYNLISIVPESSTSIRFVLGMIAGIIFVRRGPRRNFSI